MNALKLYWTQRRQESIATFTVLVTSSLMFLIPALWYPHPLVVFTAWMLSTSGIVGHAITMVLCHRQQQKLKLSSNSFARMLVSVMLLLALIRAEAADTSPYTQLPPLPGTIAPFEFDVQISTVNDNQDNPQAVIPAAVCVGIGIGIIGWVGIKLWSACLNQQIRNLTNRPPANFQAAGDPITSPPNINTSNPVTGSGCSCEPPPTVTPPAPLPFLLEHYNGQSWAPVSIGIVPGQQHFVPDTGTWRITPMRIVATPDSMIVPPGTLEESVDLRTWAVVSVGASTRTATPEPNHFYRIR